MLTLGLDGDMTWRRQAARPAEARTITLADFPSLASILTTPSASGVAVTQSTALGVTAYWNGVQIIAGTMGVVDRCLYRRVGEDDREKATTHPVYKVIHDSPNKYMTPQVFWETVMSHAVSWGNGYAEIEWDQAMRPIALWPITPDKIEPMVDVRIDELGRRISTVWYRYCGKERLEAEDVLHIPGLGFDGLKGYSPVSLFRQSLGLSLAAERYGAGFFGEGAMHGVALEHPNKVGDQAYERMKASLRASRGPDRAHVAFILEEGMKVSKPITIPPEDAQFLETRQFQVEETARILNLPPHKLKHKGGERPGGNIETEQINFLTDTLLPWATRLEQECNRKLISSAQRSTFYVEHQFAKILRTDASTRQKIQRGYYDMNVLTSEQIARQENLPKPEPPATPPVQVTPAPPPAPASEDQRSLVGRAASAQREVLLDAVGRFVRRESAAAKRASKRGPQAFQAWADDFYAREVEVLREFLAPGVGLVLGLGGVDGDARGLSQGLARGYVERSRGELLALPHKDLEAAVARLIERWRNTRTAEMVELIAALGVVEEKGNAA